jgi:hypothetical protein
MNESDARAHDVKSGQIRRTAVAATVATVATTAAIAATA